MKIINKITLATFLLFFFFQTNAQLGAFKISSGSAIQIGYNNYRYLSFGISPTTPNNGNWAIENFDDGLNFWKPWPSYNYGNFKFYISDYGGVGIDMKPYVGTRTTPRHHSIWTFKLQVNGRIVGDGLWSWSDQNLKENIVNIDSGMQTLLKLRPVSYNFKSNRILGDSINTPIDTNYIDIEKYNSFNSDQSNIASTQHDDLAVHYGFIAQEVEQVFPAIVADIGDKKAINYVELIPVLVKAIQQQQKNIEDLKAEIDLLKANNVTLGTTTSKLYQNDPNPFVDNTNITYYIDENIAFTTAIIEVRDLYGVLKNTIPLVDKSGLGKISYNFGSLINGYYVYSLLIDNRTVDTKLFLINRE